MPSRIDLVWLGNHLPAWELGAAHAVEASVPDLHQHLQRLTAAADTAGHLLLWDARLGMPDPEKIRRLTALPGHLWHAGLKLGMSGQPGIIDFFAPTWMLNRDPDPQIEATSWRLSLHACLIRADVLRQMGGIDPGFATLEGAALEMGHRYITRGVLMRHIPWMTDATLPPEPLPFEDEVRFLRCRAGKFWRRWALARAVMSRYVSPARAVRAWSAAERMPCPPPSPYQGSAAQPARLPDDAAVSVLIPTIDRYPYLRTLLDQLRAQTVRPHEIIIVDQTEPARRDTTLLAAFPDLSLKLITLERAGQCSSRNLGLKAATGTHVLFLDDDDEITPDLIEKHLICLAQWGNEVSCGTAHVPGDGPLPENFTFRRISDVFPTNNMLLQKAVLHQSGLFDLAYERMQRADGDLGMRVYLSGALMVYDPEISVLHHHAPRGGLRTHKARVITYASSRRSLMQRHLPSISEVYLGLRYFTPRQVRESLWMRAAGTFAVRGGMGRRLLKGLIMLALLPDTVLRIRHAHREARRMLVRYPQIAQLDALPESPDRVIV